MSYQLSPPAYARAGNISSPQHNYPPIGVSLQQPSYQSQALGRDITRTPSPTQSEIDALNSTGLFSVRDRLAKKGKTYMYAFYGLMLLILVAVILGLVFQHQIVKVLQPAANWMKKCVLTYFSCSSISHTLEVFPQAGLYL